MFDKFKTWWERPFSTDMGGLQWVAFLIFILIVCAMWRSVVNLMQEIAQ